MAMLVDNQKIEQAKGAITRSYENSYKKGTEFIEALTNVLSTFQGETKDVLMEKKIGSSGSETEGTLAYFVEKQIPNLLDGLLQLLEANRKTIDESDLKLAEAISGNGQG